MAGSPPKQVSGREGPDGGGPRSRASRAPAPNADPVSPAPPRPDSATGPNSGVPALDPDSSVPDSASSPDPSGPELAPLSSAPRPDPSGPDPDPPTPPAQEIARLTAELNRHDHLYFVKDAPEISDREYDELFRRLVELEEAHPDMRAADSPTRRVGADPVKDLPSAEHVAPMLSLDSSYELGDVRRFDERVRKALDAEVVQYVLEPKLDGASLELVYEDGVLARAVTRGNGRVGEVVTENVRTIRSVPLRLDGAERAVPALLAVRGEAIVPISDFELLNRNRRRKSKPEYKNPRNVAAGALRNLDSRVAARRPLAVLAFDVLAMEGADAFSTDRQALKALKEWGLRIPERVKTAESVEQIADYHRDFDDRRDELDYDIDGIVVKVNGLPEREKLRATSHHPRWAMALKFKPRRVAMGVRAIETQIGRTGAITPVARLWPAKVGGVVVSNATLHNREEADRLGLRVGDLVWVQRAGDVIPQVMGRVDRGDRFVMPEACPSCGAELVDRGPRTMCPNGARCPKQLEGRIVHFASRGALDIEGLGEETVSQLVQRGLVRELGDLFDLTVEGVDELERQGSTSAQNLIEAIQAGRTTQLARFIVGLGIPSVGAATARDLAARFRDFAKFREASPENMEEVDGIGSTTALAVRAFFDNPDEAPAIDNVFGKMVELVPPPAPPKGDEAEAWAGKTVVLTGSLKSSSRAEMKERLEAHGVRVLGQVSKRTDFLIAGANPGSKLARAKELGVPVLNENEARERFSFLAPTLFSAEDGPAAEAPGDPPPGPSAEAPAAAPAAPADAALPPAPQDPKP